MRLTRKTCIRGTCFETFGRWVPLKRGQELIILISGYQFAKTLKIPSRFKFRSSLFYSIFQGVSTTLQYCTRTEKKEQQITNIMKGKISE